MIKLIFLMMCFAATVLSMPQTGIDQPTKEQLILPKPLFLKPLPPKPLLPKPLLPKPLLPLPKPLLPKLPIGGPKLFPKLIPGPGHGK